MNKRQNKKYFKKSIAQVLNLTYGTIMRKYLAEFYREFGHTYFEYFETRNVLIQIRHDACNPRYFLKTDDEYRKYYKFRDAVLLKPIYWMSKYKQAKKRNVGYFLPSVEVVMAMSQEFGGSC